MKTLIIIVLVMALHVMMPLLDNDNCYIYTVCGIIVVTITILICSTYKKDK